MPVYYIKTSEAGTSPKQKEFIYVALGDSTAEGIGASSPEKSYPALIYKALQREYKVVQFYNYGKMSVKSRHVLDLQVEKAIRKQPNLITLSVGANDIRFGITIRTFAKQMKEILQKLQRDTFSTIIVSTIPDFSEVPRTPQLLKVPSAIAIRRYNDVIKSIADELKILYADIFTKSKEFSEIVAKDGFHPSDTGYALWAESILRVLDKNNIQG